MPQPIDWPRISLKGEKGMISRDKENSWRMYRGFLFLVIFLCALLVPFSGKASQKGPLEVITELNSTVLESMKNGK
jgi:hypothetical protein